MKVSMITVVEFRARKATGSIYKIKYLLPKEDFKNIVEFEKRNQIFQLEPEFITN